MCRWWCGPHATLAICLPTLGLFNLFYGGRLTVVQVLALSLAAIRATAARTVAFARPYPLDRLVAEIQELEQRLVSDLTHRLLGQSTDQRAVLDRRLATLRDCAREMAGLTDEASARSWPPG